MRDLGNAEKTVADKEIMTAGEIPHRCWSCARGFYTEEGFECYEAHYNGDSPDCLNWVWKGRE